MSRSMVQRSPVIVFLLGISSTYLQQIAGRFHFISSACHAECLAIIRQQISSGSLQLAQTRDLPHFRSPHRQRIITI